MKLFNNLIYLLQIKFNKNFNKCKLIFYTIHKKLVTNLIIQSLCHII